MNTRLLLRLFTTATLITTAFAGDPPAYPGQPNINLALRRLTDAKEHLVTGATPADISEELKKAHNALEMAIKNKGSFRATAIRLTGQAMKHLEKGDRDTAAREINEAIEAVNKAGQAGER